MERKTRIIQNHRYDKSQEVVFEGISYTTINSDFIEIMYTEVDKTEVSIKIYESHMEIIRRGELKSNLLFLCNKVTRNKIESEYGLLEIDIYTYAYNRKHDKIVVEYDILSNDELGYILEIQVEEGFSEFN